MTYNEGLEAAARWHDCQAAALKSGRSHSLRKIKRFHKIAAQEIRSKVMAPVPQVETDNAAQAARIKEYIAARDAYEDATRPRGAFGASIFLKPNDPRVIRYREARAALGVGL